MPKDFFSLIQKLSGLDATSDVIGWSSPVPYFGDYSQARLATVGINPSNREFVCSRGYELENNERRFHTLRSLGISDWSKAKKSHALKIEETCRNYFFTNPYDAWFRRIDKVISGTSYSYYNGKACHIDLVPFATARKWSSLSSVERDDLMLRCAEEMKNIVAESELRTLVLNGSSVIDRFSELYEIDWTVMSEPAWNLQRKSGRPVAGKSYKASLEIGTSLRKRKIMILGFNHNIQSSFGVTSEAIMAIRKWITSSISEHDLEAAF
jgi:hypothetical protein